MLNLLPKEEKKKISHEYRVRFAIVALTLTFFALIVSLVLLVPSYFTAEVRKSTLDSESAGVEAKNATAESAKLGETLRQTNASLSIFTSSTTPTGVVGLLDNISALRGTTVRIQDFSYTAAKGQQQIVINGKGDTRQALVDFTKKIRNLPNVVSVDLPVSDLAEAQNINFSVIILIQQKNP